jgi:16S rRNA G527 N7-methylase RsmG
MKLCGQHLTCKNSLNLDSFVTEIQEMIDRKKRTSFLRALGGGLQLPNGSIIKTKMDLEAVQQAFKSQALLYEAFADPIGLNDFLAFG